MLPVFALTKRLRDGPKGFLRPSELRLESLPSVKARGHIFEVVVAKAIVTAAVSIRRVTGSPMGISRGGRFGKALRGGHLLPLR